MDNIDDLNAAINRRSARQAVIDAGVRAYLDAEARGDVVDPLLSIRAPIRLTPTELAARREKRERDRERRMEAIAIAKQERERLLLRRRKVLAARKRITERRLAERARFHITTEDASAKISARYDVPAPWMWSWSFGEQYMSELELTPLPARKMPSEYT